MSREGCEGAEGSIFGGLGVGRWEIRVGGGKGVGLAGGGGGED